jgi:hypothetical protein
MFFSREATDESYDKRPTNPGQSLAPPMRATEPIVARRHVDGDPKRYPQPAPRSEPYRIDAGHPMGPRAMMRRCKPHP